LEVSKEGESPRNYFWSFPEIEAGETEQMTVAFEVGSSIGEIEAVVEALTETVENELNNNTASDLTNVYSSGKGNSSNNDDDDDDDDEEEFKIKVTRSLAGGNSYRPGDLITHSLIVENDSDEKVYDVDVRDKMKFLGNTLVDYTWSIGNLDEDETILIQYQLMVNSVIPPGVYEYSARAKGEDSDGDEVRSKKSIISVNIINDYGFLGEGGEEEPVSLVSTAQASDNLTPAVLGIDEETQGGLPVWLWLLALVSYNLAINWSFFPLNSVGTMSQLRSQFTPILATLVAGAFWLKYADMGTFPWFIILVFISLALQYYYKNKKTVAMG